jgi:hypothetical protein
MFLVNLYADHIPSLCVDTHFKTWENNNTRKKTIRKSREGMEYHKDLLENGIRIAQALEWTRNWRTNGVGNGVQKYVIQNRSVTEDKNAYVCTREREREREQQTQCASFTKC